MPTTLDEIRQILGITKEEFQPLLSKTPQKRNLKKLALIREAFNKIAPPTSEYRYVPLIGFYTADRCEEFRKAGITYHIIDPFTILTFIGTSIVKKVPEYSSVSYVHGPKPINTIARKLYLPSPEICEHVVRFFGDVIYGCFNKKQQ